jgi:branched-subunit amino acid transport protein AzlD
MAAVTFFTRVFPFLFYRHKKPPEIILFVGKYIPPVVITILVVYCLKDIDWGKAPYGFNEMLAVLLVFILHGWRRNPLLSIFGATLFYMFLAQTAVINRLM